MSSEKKIKALIGIIIFLLLSNIVMLIFFVVSNDNKKESGKRSNLIGTYLQNDISFSPQQMEVYDTMRNQYFRNMKPFFEALKSSKDSFYILLYTDDLPDTIANSRVATIGQRQVEIDKKFFNFLTEVRKLCKEEQLTKFDSSFKYVVSKITGKSGKGSDHKNEK